MMMMINLRLRPSSESARRRTRWLWRALFVLLALHAVLVYAVPEFPMLTRRGVGWLLAGAPGALSKERPKIITKGGRTYLWGGPHESNHFDITESPLEPEQFHFGAGRERIPALVDPQFTAPSQAGPWLTDSQRVLAVTIGGTVRVYPLEVLRSHEVVNDVVGGRPIVAAYCYLADLGAVYDREIAGHTYTFALSGYTYADPDVWGGRDAFVLWDRDTESLWWPPLGRAVSGTMLDTPLPLLDTTLWAQSTWGEIKARYPDARILKSGQTPTTTAPLSIESRRAMRRLPDKPPADRPAGDPIAPRWGGNARLDPPD